MNTKPLRSLVVLALVCAVGPFFAATPKQSPEPMLRFALVAGSNGGGSERMRLKYADSDARSFAAVLSELGGVKDENLILLADPDLLSFQAALQRMREIVTTARRDGTKCELVVYYSGHSDETGLLLGADTLPYAALRGDIDRIPASVRVAILDSCASGALTRAKGGVSRPAFLFDASTDMKGHAFLTSSSAEESAQESDRLGASFFTHYLVSGLRGAADLNGEGIVTLNEAYAFAFKETLASTENAQYGPQHPAYEINLTGSGDLVLTDLRSSSAGLSLAEELSGRMYIRDAGGALVVELRKNEGKKMEIGLEPGRYSLVLDRPGARYRAEASAGVGQRVTVRKGDFKRMAEDAATARGEEPRPRSDESSESVKQFFSISLFPDFYKGVFSSDVDHAFSINLLAGACANLGGLEVAGLASIEAGSMHGIQVAGLGNIVRKDVVFLQAAGLMNYGGEVRAMQAAGLANVASASLRGLQIAGLGNVVNADSGGAQVAGLVNYSRDGLAGLQLASIGNYAATVDGAQFGLVNIAKGSSDVQFGLVNVAGTVDGVQVGLVNVAREMKGLPLGLVSVEPGGIRAFEAWCDIGLDTAPVTNLGLKIGTRHTYTLIAAGYTPASDPIDWSYGLGLGGRFKISGIFLDADLSWRSGLSGFGGWQDSKQEPELRLLAGIPVGDFSIVAGAALDAHIRGIWKSDDVSSVDFLPRFVLGIQI